MQSQIARRPVVVRCCVVVDRPPCRTLQDARRGELGSLEYEHRASD